MTDRYAYPEPFYAPGWTPPRPRTDGVAVASLVTGVLGLGPVALVLGLVGLRRTRPGAPGRRGGRGFAVAGVALGAAGTLAWAALVALGVGTALASRPLPADVAEPVDARAVQLVPGNCVEDLPADGRVDRVRVVPCTDPHAAQVVSAYAFEAGAAWPGPAEASARVQASCALTEDERAAGLQMLAWAPTERSWAGGDRTGLCLAVPPAPVTGSLLDGSAAPA
ncbi:DUF4190 domain-containing protein [Cellulomonas pakistanensis]|uniref:DUF4190 domain-containing protein n=1 Tax=Cellulomonas pakistanensis TaxID=992287 RepID=A0A919U7K5_9CELL|nr:DUF4190 domain-containing protein [Cellulomonas pakistanensis]GIG37092.1 hypothetical protein Cpa01nite_24730 [Cellulomonas pakistanensis]